jgi:PAS domain-containing protein
MERFEVVSLAAARRRVPILGARLTVEVTVVMAAALLVLPFVDASVSDAPVLSFMVAIGLCAARFGIPGGVTSGLCGAAISTTWYLQGSHYSGGLVDFLWEAVAFVVVGVLVGSAVSDRRDLERAVSRHGELSVDLICTATFDGFFTRLNPSWERVLGFRPSELRARPFLDFVHPDDLDATIATVGGLTVAGSEVLNFQNRFRCKRAATAATGQHCHDTEHHHLRCPVDHSFPDHMPTVSEAPRRATIPAPRADTSAPDRAALEYGCAIDTWPGRVHEDALVREHV